SATRVCSCTARPLGANPRLLRARAAAARSPYVSAASNLATAWACTCRSTVSILENPTWPSGRAIRCGPGGEIQNLSHPPATLPGMGTVTSIEAWRSEHPRDDPAERLERAVEGLDSVLRGTPRNPKSDAEVERELLAITGAVSIGMLEEAA